MESYEFIKLCELSGTNCVGVLRIVTDITDTDYNKIIRTCSSFDQVVENLKLNSAIFQEKDHSFVDETPINSSHVLRNLLINELNKHFDKIETIKDQDKKFFLFQYKYDSDLQSLISKFQSTMEDTDELFYVKMLLDSYKVNLDDAANYNFSLGIANENTRTEDKEFEFKNRKRKFEKVEHTYVDDDE